ncbi:uncharacterized protein K02A2.6-like [Strongylocentrotus purpuratus]|uniref:Polyprotein n=1 Tax=Strongylocentrotus purpuratus TaxID=7668 RepID=A0A7M7GH93_STRPU|nr:uncharacterized protein K02A2.6-like [Strongylocentrotus purpuratus]|eukprot:XP_003726960.1 PREDICTED: uncharacterized protein K02A2.6-like [Strongylocentrotus purpuratus]
MRETVEKELHRLQAAGIITRVEFADRAAPIVPVVKSDGTIRVCGDCKMTVNQAAKVDRYPLPLIDNFFAQVGGGKIFTTLDMSYPTTPGIFQKSMPLQGLPGVVAYLDDILVSGETQTKHEESLERVLHRFQEARVRLKREKCVFGTTEVVYLGYNIDAQGLHPVENKVQAVRDTPSPSNVSEGWAGAYKEETLKPYYSRWNELNTDSEVVLWVSRVDVVLRDVILRQLHEGNPGVTRMKEVARSYVWWPGMDKRLEDTVKSFCQCQDHRRNPPVTPLNPWP